MHIPITSFRTPVDIASAKRQHATFFRTHVAAQEEELLEICRQLQAGNVHIVFKVMSSEERDMKDIPIDEHIPVVDVLEDFQYDDLHGRPTIHGTNKKTGEHCSMQIERRNAKRHEESGPLVVFVESRQPWKETCLLRLYKPVPTLSA